MKFIDLKAQYSQLQNEINVNIQSVLNSGQYIMGPEVFELEEAISDYLNVKHVITCANGTDALTMLYMAYEIKAGDAVFCPDITFFATAEAVALLGATPVFCDVEPDTFNLSIVSLEKQIQAVLRDGKLMPRAVVPIDFLGNPANYAAIAQLCQRYNLILIEDAAQSFGATYQGKHCGTLGDSATTSFFPAKPLGCYGDGGAVMTNDDQIAEYCRSIRIHGKGVDKYDNVRIGLNSRLDTLQAAILLPKLDALRNYEIEARQAIAARYDQAFRGTFQTLRITTHSRSAYAQYALLARNQQERDFILDELKNAAIPAMVYYRQPQHVLKAFEGLTSFNESFDVSIDYCQRTFSIPMHPYLDRKQQDTIIQTILCARRAMLD